MERQSPRAHVTCELKSTQLRLALSDGRPLTCVAEGASQRAAEESGSDAPPVECPVGCRGTTACLCGQGELSDNPVWIEND